MTVSRVVLLLAFCLATVTARPVDEQTSMSFDSQLALTAEGALVRVPAIVQTLQLCHGAVSSYHGTGRHTYLA